MRISHIALLVLLAVFPLGSPSQSNANQPGEFFVYSVYREIGLGGAEGLPPKDYYINMGAMHGLQPGSVLEVTRKQPSFDLVSQQFYKDISFPIALLKVIHVEQKVAIARVEKMLPLENTPGTSFHAVMIGDSVRVVSSILPK